MKVIDLLVKIANGEDLRFKLINDEEAEDDIFEVENGHLRNSTCGKWLEMKINCDNWKSINRYFLNQEVEIIEEEKELHANEIVFNCDNNKRECVITLDENDLGIDKLHMDNCYFYKENGKWYVKKYDFKTIKLEEEKKIPKKLGDYSLDEKGKYPIKTTIYEEILKDKINEIIDYLKENNGRD